MNRDKIVFWMDCFVFFAALTIILLAILIRDFGEVASAVCVASLSLRLILAAKWEKAND